MHAFSDYYADKMKNLDRESTYCRDIETIAFKKKLQLVEHWTNCDIAKNDIFIVKNRNKLSTLQVFTMCINIPYVLIVQRHLYSF